MTPHDLLDTEELAELLGLQPTSLRTMRARREQRRPRTLVGLPEPLRLVSGRPVWRRSDVEKWMDSHVRPAS